MTTKQTTGAQSLRDAILEWFADLDVADRDEHTDAAQPGADDFRGAFRELFDADRDDHYADIVDEALSPCGIVVGPDSYGSDFVH